MSISVAERAWTRAPGETSVHRLPAAGKRPVDFRVQGVCKRYGDLAVLDDISLDVQRGDSVALIGANGAGKSTLLRCCLRLVEPDNGSVEVLGSDISALPRRQLRQLRARVGFVFQRHNLVPRLSALANVVHGAQARGYGLRAWHQAVAPALLRAQAMACLERVGLAQAATRRADQLSGGQSQRVAIARALMQQPQAFMADEPVASLDPAAGEEVMRLFVQLVREEGSTLLFTSHNLDHALQHADRIVALKGSRVALDVAACDAHRAELERVYE